MNDSIKFDFEFGEIEFDPDYRGFHFRLDDGIKTNPHHKELRKYMNKLIKEGVTRYNVDHVSIGGRDKSISLNRGNRRIDLAYWQDGTFYECELKTAYEIGLNRIWDQIREQSKNCERLTLLVPSSEVANAESLVRMQKLLNVYVQSYE